MLFRSTLSRPLGRALTVSALGALGVAGCGDGPTVVDKLSQMDKKDEEPASSGEAEATEAKAKAQTKKDRESSDEESAKPTEAEFEAWNRKDPEGEKHLYKWDKAHLKDLVRYWEELNCFREKIKVEGEAAADALPGSPEAEQFHQFKRAFRDHLDRWQQRIFAEQPRILENSKMLADLLAAHELVMLQYPKAYSPRDDVGLKEADLRWKRIELKLEKYVKGLGRKLPHWSPDDKRAWAKHERVCAAALKPKKRGRSR